KLVDGKAEIAKQEQVLGTSKEQLAASRQALDNAAATLRNQGIDPNLNTAELENQLSQLSNYEATIQGSLSQVIAAAQETPDGELIVGPEFISLSNQGINALEQVPGLDLSQLGTSEAQLRALAQQISETEMTPEIRQQIISEGAVLQGQLSDLPS